MATKTKPKKAAAKPRTAKSPTASGTMCEVVFKGNGETLLRESCSQKQLASIWKKVPNIIAKAGIGKYTMTFDVTEITPARRTANTNGAR